jgi:hypothetical protein
MNDEGPLSNVLFQKSKCLKEARKSTENDLDDKAIEIQQMWLGDITAKIKNAELSLHSFKMGQIDCHLLSKMQFFNYRFGFDEKSGFLCPEECQIFCKRPNLAPMLL